jgi:hypothetical protein
MAATSQWYGQAATGLIARMWVPTQMGVILMVPSFVVNIDSQLRYSDISANELASGGGYTVGGKQITGRSTSYDAAADEYNLLGDDLTWGPGATFTTGKGVIYEMTTTDKWLWAILDFGGPIDVANGVFQIDWTAGLLSVVTGPPV